MPFLVAIDGPSGAGKSSAARRLAERLALTWLDTGAIYRALTLELLSPSDPSGPLREAKAEILSSFRLRFEASHRVFVGDREVTEAIRSPEVTARVSEVAALPEVRKALLGIQRDLAQKDPKGAVLEGRDIATVVLPDADLKVFLTASVEVRAARRAKELAEQGWPADLDDLRESMRLRDAKDTNRAQAPLRQAEDAHLLDASDLDLDAVLSRLVALAKAAGFSGAA